MSRNGSGTYTLPAGNPVVTGTTISSTWSNTTLTDIATALTGSLASDGQTTATGNLKMGNNRVTGLADGIASTDAATVNQIPSGALFLLKASNLSDVANATTARGNLVAAKSGANSDITSITGLTTPLTVAQGGIGAATLTANNVLLGNGTSAPQVVAPSTTGNVLTSNGTTWVSSAPTVSSGTAKAWVNFDPSSGSSCTIRSSFNVSSVTYNATGSYTVNFTTSFADTNYVAVGTSSVKIGNTATIFCPNWTPPGTETASATGSFKCGVVLTTTAATDPVYVYIAFFAS
jgi:hypothetical protein